MGQLVRIYLINLHFVINNFTVQLHSGIFRDILINTFISACDDGFELSKVPKATSESFY